jgi:hypothetical protein
MIARTLAGSAETPSKFLRFRSFHIFQTSKLEERQVVVDLSCCGLLAFDSTRPPVMIRQQAPAPDLLSNGTHASKPPSHTRSADINVQRIQGPDRREGTKDCKANSLQGACPLSGSCIEPTAA